MEEASIWEVILVAIVGGILVQVIFYGIRRRSD